MAEELIKETAILVPHLVIKKAKELYNMKLYEAALELLSENAVVFDIYELNNKVSVSIPYKKYPSFGGNKDYLPKPKGRVKGKGL